MAIRVTKFYRSTVFYKSLYRENGRQRFPFVVRVISKLCVPLNVHLYTDTARLRSSRALQERGLVVVLKDLLIMADKPLFIAILCIALLYASTQQQCFGRSLRIIRVPSRRS